MSVPRFGLLILTLATALGLASGCSRSSEATDAIAADSAPSAPQAKANWLTSYEQGQQEALASHRLVLLNFTGSDWCGWCKLLDKEVFSQPQFKEYASKNLVLVELDFPKGKRVSEAIRTQNLQLAYQYQVQGFPTIVLLNGEGQKVGEMGYVRGGPAAFIAELERLRKG